MPAAFSTGKDYDERCGMENNRTKEDLKIMQSWPLERKIQVTQTRIIEWYLRWQGMVYVSFSGGKDSTVLLDLARRVYPEIEAVFCDTGLEYPEIREFVKTKENVTWLHPVRYDREKREWVRTNFKAVIEEEGYPIISKSVSKRVRYWQNGSRSNWILKSFNNENTYTSLNMGKWTYLKDAPFKVSERCCNVMKKQPFHLFNKKTGKYPIVGTMAEEVPKENCLGYKQDAIPSTVITQFLNQCLFGLNKMYCSI